MLMDFLLPGKDGLEVIKSLKQGSQHTFYYDFEVEDQAMISQAYKGE